MKFLHTADWQLGKPFAGISDDHKRVLVQQERVNVLHRIGQLVQAEQVDFVLVAGDLFDSFSPQKATVSAACNAIGGFGVPVYVIPGNHDHGGPGSVWEQPFFLREKEALAPNMHVLLQSETIDVGPAVILPCPLLRRAESVDTTSWLRDEAIYSTLPQDKPRIVLAHGSVQSFVSQGTDDDEGDYATNLIDLKRLPEAEIDFIALGDWHGLKQVGPKAWYSGTPEMDRFRKGDQEPGHILVVEASRGATPVVKQEKTGRLEWSEYAFEFSSEESLGVFIEDIQKRYAHQTNEGLLRLQLSGHLGMEALTKVEELIESLEARLLRVKLANRVTVVPAESEIALLAERSTDPLISRVAQRLVEMTKQTGEEGETARQALRTLYASVSNLAK